MIRAIGIDPDLHHLALAVVDLVGDKTEPGCAAEPVFELQYVHTFDVADSDKGLDAFASMVDEMVHWSPRFDGTSIYPDGTSIYPDDIDVAFVENPKLHSREGGAKRDAMHLITLVAGGAASACASWGVKEIVMRPPHTVPKPVFQRRTLRRLGLEFEETAGKKMRVRWPWDDVLGLPVARQSHIIDACGVAVYGLMDWMGQIRRGLRSAPQRVAPSARTARA